MFKKTDLPDATNALPGREEKIPVPEKHYVLGVSMQAPFPEDAAAIQLGVGCFWGAEKKFWQLPGVHTTAVGYAGGHTPNPTYEEVCSGRTGHTEVVLVVYRDDAQVLRQIFKAFWEGHDPTQGMRQGNDIGTQYRSAIYTSSKSQTEAAEESLKEYQTALTDAGKGAITTELKQDKIFYYAEAYHQQYLAKNPRGYCGLGGTGVCFG